jgi:hypothetical protein
MASNWVEFRDKVLDAVKVEEITEEVKQDFTNWLLSNLLPALKPAAANFVGQVRTQAADETGWCKVRDLIVLPFIVDGGLWLIEKALVKTTQAKS